MKKTLLTTILFFSMTAAMMAQEYNAYCELIGRGTKSSHYKIKGEVGVFFSIADSRKPLVVTDSKGKEREFNTMLEAVAYFERHGWELFQCYATQEESGMVGVSVYHYLLRKTVTNDAQIKEGLSLKEK
jgi:hypothetical protein